MGCKRGMAQDRAPAARQYLNLLNNFSVRVLSGAALCGKLSPATGRCLLCSSSGPSRKPPPTAATSAANEDFDDFDPRGSTGSKGESSC